MKSSLARAKNGIKKREIRCFPNGELESRKTDFVVSHLAFHHVKNKLLVMTETCKILPTKGRLIIGDCFKPTRAYEKKIEKLIARARPRTNTDP